MPKVEIKLDRQSRVSVPLVPNFIKLDGNFQALSTFTEAQLRAIGEAWIERLVARAEEQRRDGVGTHP